MFLSGISALFKKADETPDYKFRGWYNKTFMGNKTKNHSRSCGPQDSGISGWARGFTLIELLVVVLIIGILSAIALPKYQKAVLKTRYAEAFTNLKVLHNAFVACELANGRDADACTDVTNWDVSIGTLRNGGLETENFRYEYCGYGNCVAMGAFELVATDLKDNTQYICFEGEQFYAPYGLDSFAKNLGLEMHDAC